MLRCILPALCLALAAATPALAQSTGGVLQAPSRNTQAAPPAATPSSHPPTPAPRAPVQQVAPMASPSLLGHSTPAKAPPVVQPPKNAHAQKVATPPGKPPATNTATHPGKPAVAGAAAGVAAGAAAAGAAHPTAPSPAPPQPEPPAETVKGPSGAPLPRWASLRSDEVNLRSGPGTRYPVQWVYRRRDLPVEIQREYEAWRLITDQDGVKGWVHSATLVGRRSFAVTGKDRTLRKSAGEDAPAVAVLKVGVVGRLRSCEAGKTWCEVQVGGYRGWLKRDEFFGVNAGEIVN